MIDIIVRLGFLFGCVYVFYHSVVKDLFIKMR